MLIHFLQRSSEELLEGRIVQAAELLAKKEFVLFIGEGTSKVLAEFGEIYFSSIYNLSASVSHLFPIPLANYPKKRLKKWALSPYQFRVKHKKFGKILIILSKWGLM